MILYVMLYMKLAYLMQLAALSNAFLCHLFLQMLLAFLLCIGLFTRSWFISNIVLHHAQCSLSDGFPNSVFTPFY